MFSKPKQDNKVKTTATPTKKVVAPSILSVDLHITGNMESDGDIQIDGRVDGDIKSKQVTIGEGATVNGAIEADYLRVSGTVNGEITGRKVELASTARVVGDINHDLLQIEAGAYLQGLCRRMDGGEASASKPGSIPAPANSTPKPAKAILDTGMKAS